MILVGNTGVGKTCLIESYLKKHFNENTSTTLTPTYSTQQIAKSDGSKVTVQIWDTAGQEKYQALSQLFFRNSDIAMFCFIAGDKESMIALHEWISMVRNESPSCKLVFVGTKSDLIDEKEFENVIRDSKAEFQQYQPQTIYLTSSKTNYNIENVFRAVSELAVISSTETVHEMEEQTTQKSCC